jgi:patatin-related protein
MATADDNSSSRNGDEKELRLALVCYGGASLAIYMHGMTKEINRLVLGSALRRRELTPDGDQPRPRTEHVYGALLDEMAKENDGLETRVVVDVVAGTSAGGINGVYLSKALAHNLSQDSLRDLWFERGDMNQLLRGPSFLPWKVRMPVLIPMAIWSSPVRGDAMAKWLYDALEGMDTKGTDPAGPDSLLSDGNELELFVTLTDFYGYDRQVQIADPLAVHERRHRHAIAFRYRHDVVDDFSRDGNGGLAFAARTTSSFPGVFPPVSFDAFRSWVPSADLRTFEEHSFRVYKLSDADPETAEFVDGGVLDNKPFGWAIDAITRRRADVEVERRLLYFEPDPGDAHLPAQPAHQEKRKPPRPIKAIAAAVSSLPSQEPILDDLLAVEAHNRRVRRLRDVIETSFDGVAAVVENVLGPLDPLAATPDIQTLAGWNDRMHDRTIEEAGPAYTTYIRLKISSTIDRYAQTVCDVCDYPADSNHAILVRHVVRALAETLGLFEQQATASDVQTSFLRNFDLGFGERRLLFVIAALRWWYGDLREGKPDIPPRADLDSAKQLIYDSIDVLRRTMAGDDFDDDLRRAVKSSFPEDGIRTFLAVKGMDEHAYVEEHADNLRQVVDQVAAFTHKRLAGFSANLFFRLAGLAEEWHANRKRDLLVRYLGFPLWDVILYPIQSSSQAGEADEVRIVRMSPFEARVLETPPTEKVKGTKWGHFWAFFDREARENDYLWGRLDGAANLIGVLIGKDHDAYRAWCLQAFDAILEEEAGSLRKITRTVDAIRNEVRAGREAVGAADG